MKAKLHALCSGRGRALNLSVTAGQIRDYIGERALLTGLPDADSLLVDHGHDADWF